MFQKINAMLMLTSYVLHMHVLFSINSYVGLWFVCGCFFCFQKQAPAYVRKGPGYSVLLPPPPPVSTTDAVHRLFHSHDDLLQHQCPDQLGAASSAHSGHVSVGVPGRRQQSVSGECRFYCSGYGWVITVIRMLMGHDARPLDS